MFFLQSFKSHKRLNGSISRYFALNVFLWFSHIIPVTVIVVDLLNNIIGNCYIFLGCKKGYFFFEKDKKY